MLKSFTTRFIAAIAAFLVLASAAGAVERFIVVQSTTSTQNSGLLDAILPEFTEKTGTRVSNPVCYPRFRASASILVQGAAFATDVPSDLYAFHRYTGNSTPLS